MNFNSVTFLGNVGQAPELRALPDGTPVCNFHIAVNESHTSENGEKTQQTLWLNVTTYRKLAELCSTSLSKGKKVLVSGKLRQRSWETDGVKHYRVEVVASTCVFLDRILPAVESEPDTEVGDGTNG